MLLYTGSAYRDREVEESKSGTYLLPLPPTQEMSCHNDTLIFPFADALDILEGICEGICQYVRPWVLLALATYFYFLIAVCLIVLFSYATILHLFLALIICPIISLVVCPFVLLAIISRTIKIEF